MTTTNIPKKSGGLVTHFRSLKTGNLVCGSRRPMLRGTQDRQWVTCSKCLVALQAIDAAKASK